MPEPSASKLIKLLEETRPAVEAALAEAERELEDLDRRRVELVGLIARARSALGEGESPTVTPAAERAAAVSSERLTLHQAMQRVLTENDNRWMTVHELANEINMRSLYEKRDRTPVDPSQIHSRANKYASLFEKERSRVRLRR